MTRTITPTHVLLNQITLAATASSVTFSSIPQNYSDLVLVINAKFTVAAELRLRFNNDSSSSYSMVQMAGAGDLLSNTGTTTFGWMTPNSLTSAGEFELYTGHVFDYSATDKHKTWLSRYNTVSGYINALANRWAKTEAITQIEFFGSSSTFTVNTTFSLYGVYA